MSIGTYSNKGVIREYSCAITGKPAMDMQLGAVGGKKQVICEAAVNKESMRAGNTNLLSDLEEALTVQFAEGIMNYYAAVTMNVEGIEQKYLILVDKNSKVDMPIKIIPIVPSGRQILWYKDSLRGTMCKLFGVANDKENLGEIYLSTIRMNRIVDKYRQGESLSKDEVKDYVQEITDWTARMTPRRKRAMQKLELNKEVKGLRRFDYAKGVSKACKRIVISDRAYASIIAESLSRGGLETGGILLGHYIKGTWYIVESTDPGLNTIHTTVHHEMDQKYHNHLYPVISRLYEKDLVLLGLWHRHPGSLNRFSSEDNKTNTEYAKAIGNGTLSLLINYVPNPQLSCYYFDYRNTGAYYQPKVVIGDKYFEGTDLLAIASEETLIKRKAQMQKELAESVI